MSDLQQFALKILLKNSAKLFRGSHDNVGLDVDNDDDDDKQRRCDDDCGSSSSSFARERMALTENSSMKRSPD